jgi:hypothetical protein
MTQPETGTFTLVRHRPGGSEIVASGPDSVVMPYIKDSKAQREDLRVSNEAGKVRRAQAQLKAERAAFEAEQADFQVYADSVAADRDAILQDFIDKLDALAARMDSFEAERAKDPDDEMLPLPPGSPSPDDGELESPKAPIELMETKIMQDTLDPDNPDLDLPRPPVSMED